VTIRYGNQCSQIAPRWHHAHDDPPKGVGQSEGIAGDAAGTKVISLGLIDKIVVALSHQPCLPRRACAGGPGHRLIQRTREESTVSDCGHQCCEISGNGYHRHIRPPADCRRCASAPEVAAADDERVAVARIVADVVGQVAPQIPGLPPGAELARLVAREALTIYAAAAIDPDVQALGERDQRSVLAGRVGLALAFPVP
jgi:hypothetical protein